ncbi:DHH phosphoesterase [Wolfiporia cocos MD-104 SS10]|uniref:DHH phosphoesterase n=1 Tax=Wolfiporia cocos (strain MD-104) TaxID=742152 RepID=A0A2H3J3R4_WOLCO|nr:DHH phosphoesterase [Wolfiporia cocos MD-104 SS10]
MDISLPEFLRLKKAAYMNDISAGKGDEWTVVMGNEAGDLDSLASAIAYAWYACNTKNSPTIPLVQGPRADLPLRAENLHALELVGIDQLDLLCIDDVPTPFPSSRFALMDHNRLTAPFTLSNARVTAIIDHHTDEGLYTDSADPRIVVPGIGSCSSLVALELKERRALQLKEDRPKLEQAPSALATLLLAAIVIDTTGLRPGGKAVEADYNAAAYLAPLTALPGSTSAETQSFAAGELHASAEVRALNATLQAKKGAVAHLGTRDLLRRDYKEYTHASSGRDVRVGMASVPVGLHEWLSREGQRKFAAETQAWMDERGLHALGILTSFRDDTKLGKSGKGRGKREQAWVVREDDGGDGELAHKLFKGLIKSEELRLKDKTWVKAGMAEGGGFGAGVHVRVWKQKNADATRKVTAPLVKAILEAPGEGADSHKSGL